MIDGVTSWGTMTLAVFELCLSCVGPGIFLNYFYGGRVLDSGWLSRFHVNNVNGTNIRFFLDSNCRNLNGKYSF